MCYMHKLLAQSTYCTTVENTTAHLSIKDYNIIVTHTELEFPTLLILLNKNLISFFCF